MTRLVVFLLIFCSCTRSIYGQAFGPACGANDFFGFDDPGRRDGKNEKDNNSYDRAWVPSYQTSYDYFDHRAYLLIGDPSDCCGVVERWWVSYKDVDNTQSTHFTVWRPTGTADEYEVIGETVRSTTGGERQYTLNGAEQIPIHAGDTFGWWTPGQEIVAYDDDAESSVIQITITTAPAVGGTQVWTGTTINANTYALRIDVGPGNAPTFTGTPYTGSVSSTVAAGVTVGAVAVADVDPTHFDSLVIEMNSHPEFTFDITTDEVITGTLTTNTGTVTLTFTVTDECGLSTTTTMVVTIVNDPPVVSQDSNTTTLREDTDGGDFLFKIDATDADPLTCQLSPASVAAGVPFEVKQIVGSSDYGIYVINDPQLSIANKAASYDLTVTCTDGVSTVESGNFNVQLLPNQPPSFINIQNSTVISSTLGIGGVVFNVIAIDPENDELDFTLTCEGIYVATCPFVINANGEVKLNRDISSENVVAYDVHITTFEARNSVGPSILTISIGDLNNDVTITNLPNGAAIPILENSAAGTSVYDVFYTDVDTGQTHTYWMTSTPTDMLPYFTISSDGKITTTGPINLEALTSPTVTLDVTVSDTVVQDTEQLTVTIINVNESPAFGSNNFSLSATDGTAGQVIGTPPFGITDPDAGDSYNLTMDCGDTSSYFYMDPATGAVSYQSDFDYDATATLPRTANCIVTVTDNEGLTDTATLRIDIADINDNVPVFNPTEYNVYLSAYAGIGPVLTVTATDGDRGTFGNIIYSLVQTNLNSPQFEITSDGVVSLQNHVLSPGSALNHSSTYTIMAYARDSGGQSASALITIVVSDTTTTTPATTTFRYITFFEDPANLAWFVPCILLLAVTFAVTTWVVYTCRGKYGCDQFMKQFRKPRGRRSYNFSQGPREDYSVRKPPPRGGHSWQKSRY